MSSSFDKAMENFLRKAKNKEKIDTLKKENEKKIIIAKHERLKPIKKLLKNFVDMKIEVYPTESYARNFTKVSREALEPVLFEVYQNESSGSWRPGISLFFDNPAEIEIAVPNEHQESELGYIIIRCTTPHPHADLLNNRIFKNADEACMALSNFLSESLANYKIEKNDE